LLPLVLGGGGSSLLGGLGGGGSGGLGGLLNRGALSHTVTGSAEINVNIAAPPGTQVAASRRGNLFKPIAMTRQTQMAHAHKGPAVGDFEFGNA
jgi:hypothetical protein